MRNYLRKKCGVRSGAARSLNRTTASEMLDLMNSSSVQDALPACRPQYELDFAAMCHKLSGKSTDTSIREIIRDSQQLLASRPVEERKNKRTKLLESFRHKISTPFKSHSRKQPLVNQTLDLESVMKDIAVCAAKYSEDFLKPSYPLSVERRTTSSEEAKEKPALIAPIPCPAAESAPEIVSFEGVLYHFNDPIVIWINKLPDVSAERGKFEKRAESIHRVQNGARISETEDALVFPMDTVIKEDISNAKTVSVFESCDNSGEKPAGFSELNAPSCVVFGGKVLSDTIPAFVYSFNDPITVRREVFLEEMVVLHVKRGPNSVFLFETTVVASVDETIPEIAKIYNNVLKVKRISVEVDELCRHGPSLPPNMVGLLEEQLEELKLCDNACDPPKGTMQRKDPLLKRNGRAPVDSDAEMILKTKTEALNMLSPEQVEHNVCLTLRKTEIALEIISGALTVVYPAGLPEYDPIREELENRQDLRGSSDEQDILDPDTAELWFAGKQLQRAQAKKLSDYVGKIERSKAVVKLQRPGFGPPGMESGLSDDEKKQLMLHAYRRQEEMKSLEASEELRHLGSKWADPQSLKRDLHGVTDVKFRPL